VVFQRIERVAPLDVPVLILGESGTGKELVAAAIHQLSGRRTARFEAVNCGGLTRELLRSELFGHERGAFTGAVDRHPGLLTTAHGGTVFLDEVGDLAPEAQVMLLRFLAEGEIRPVGSTRVSRADVRVIAATHRDLTTWMREERFREDLFYRLRRVVLTMPPLRERPEDLPLLVEHVRRQVNARHRLAIEGVTSGAMRRLATYRWPGNVREMEAVLEEAMIVKNQGWLRPQDLTLQEAAEETAASTDSSEAADVTRYLGSRQRVALELARAHGFVTRSRLAAACGISGELARRELHALVALGLLRRGGEGRGTRYGLF
jgi:DNA-binding NtrC family response regulator